ncbi:MAG: MFS transporter [Acetobacteraceae bacterium]
MHPRDAANDARVPAPPRNLFLSVVPPIVLPVFLAAADGTVVAVALPAIAATFGEVERLSWVVVANLIANTIAAPAYGRLGDLLGRRNMMLAALAIFMAASVLCAFSTSLPMLICARILQGFGGGGLMTLAQALVGQRVPARSLGSYQGYLSTCIVAGATFSPVAGGFVTEAWGWQAVFLSYLPLCAVAMVLVARLPRDPPSQGRGSFDATGLVLLTGFIVPLLLALSSVQRLDPSAVPMMLALVAVSTAALALLIWQQLRAPAPLLAIRLIRQPAFWRSDVMAACSGASLTALLTFLPIYLQVVTGASPAETGLLLLPLTFSVSSGSVVTGWLISRSGRTAIFPSIGLMVTAATLIVLAIWSPVLSRSQISWILALGGVCQGASMITAQVTVQVVAGPRQLGAAAASVQLARALGSAFGVALAGAVLFTTLSALDPSAASLFFEAVRRGPHIIAMLPGEQQAAVQAEIAAAFRGVFLTVACFSCTIVVMAWTLPVRRL